MRQRLKELRKNILNLSQDAFAKKLGMNRSSISLLEKGERNITDSFIVSICSIFNANENWLRNGTGEIFNLPEDEVAAILSEIMENPESEFFQMILKFAHTYIELSSESQKVMDEYIKKLFEKLNQKME